MFSKPRGQWPSILTHVTGQTCWVLHLVYCVVFIWVLIDHSEWCCWWCRQCWHLCSWISMLSLFLCLWIGVFLVICVFFVFKFSFLHGIPIQSTHCDVQFEFIVVNYFLGDYLYLLLYLLIHGIINVPVMSLIATRIHYSNT